MNQPKAIKVLRDMPLFVEADDAVFEVLSVGDLRHFHCRELLFTMGEPAANEYLLLNGVARTTVGSQDGRGMLVHLYDRPNLVGDLSNKQDSYLYDGMAMAPSLMLVLKSGTLLQLAKKNPQFALNLLDYLSQKNKEYTCRWTMRVFSTLENRVASTLLAYLCTLGVVTPQEGSISRECLTQQDIADGAATTIRSVQRLLRSWEDAGVLLKDRKFYRFQMRLLKNLAHSNREEVVQSS